MNRLATSSLLLVVACTMLPVFAEEPDALSASPAAASEDAPPRNLGAAGAESIPAQRIAVLQLQMQGPYAQQLRDWLPAFLEAKLVENGWTVVARGETMRAIQQEQNLPGVDPTTAPEKNKLYGATALLKLTARVDVNDIDAVAHLGFLSIGGLVRVKFHLNGEIADTTTGVLQPVGPITTKRSKVKRLAVVFPQISWAGGGYNIRGIRDTLVGSAADGATNQLVRRLNALHSTVPGRFAAIPVEQETIVLSFPPRVRPVPSAQYGIYRGDTLIAKVQVISFKDGRATCRVLAAIDQIRPTDRARPLEVVVPVEVEVPASG